MANPTGKSGPRDKPYRDALKRAIARAAATPDDPHSLDRIAEQHLAKAASGDMQAVRELGDRIDGKVAQAIIGGDDDDNPVQLALIERRIVDANPPNPDSAGIQAATDAKPV